MKRIICLLVVLSTPISASECVILLHGLARTANSMNQMEHALKEAGYSVANINYPSRKSEVEKLADSAIKAGLSQCPSEAPISFVSHSMGGILIRQYLALHSIDRLKRVVMLGPPNHGSQVIDKMANTPGFKLINGPAGLQLGTGKASLPNKLGPANFDLGIIAGTRSINLIFSSMLPNADDGKVSVESTKLEGMSEHLEMPVTHTFMMRNPKVINQVIHYLQNGAFKKLKD